MQTFEDWWKEWSETIWKAGGLASPNQVKLLFKDCFSEGFQAGFEKRLAKPRVEGQAEYNSDS